MRRTWVFVSAILAASGALAQEAPADFEAGVRYWLNTGSTKRSHDASSFSPLLGNPTSTLIYGDLDANAAELYARKRFGERWFVKGNLGVGKVNTGTFTDQDFFVFGGQLFMAQTVSAVSGKLRYGSVDVGRDLWQLGNTTVALFAGYQQWNERLDGHGLSDSFGPFGLPPDTLVISNDLTWKSWRLGVETRAVRGRTRFGVEVALVPYAEYRNEDSHYLRSQPVGSTPGALGPVPNVIATGRGMGVQAEAELRRSFPDLWGLEFAIGYRYWRLDSQKGEQTAAGLTFPIVDLVSERHGVTFAVGKAW